MATVTLGLGTNLGDRLGQLVRARAALAPVVSPLRCSAIYETQPWGVTDQPPFLNAVCQGTTTLAPPRLLVELKAIEQHLGRVASRRWGPRAIDLDLLFYDDLVLATPGLTIPHPRLHERAFVLVPLAELDPRLTHPIIGASATELAARVDATGVHRAALQWPDA